MAGKTSWFLQRKLIFIASRCRISTITSRNRAMSIPHFRRKYELMSFAFNIAVPLALVAVVGAQHVQLSRQAQKLDTLEADIATIKLNSLPMPSYDTPKPSSNKSTNSAITPNK